MANATWEPERFASLNKVLEESLVQASDSGTFDQLKKQLEEAKPDLAGLFEYPGKNAQHRGELSKGTPSINGEKFKVSCDFVTEATKLSDFLDVDEDLAATLVHKAVGFEKRFELPAGESAILLFYSEREAKLTSLITLFGGGASPTADEAVRVELEKVVGSILSSTLKSSSKMFPERIIETMGQLKTRQEQVGALLNGPSADVPYQREVVEFVQAKLGDERKQLAMLLFVIVRDYQLNFKELILVIEWLRGSNVDDPATLRMAVTLLVALGTSGEGTSQELAEVDALNKINHLVRESEFLVKINEEIIDKAWSDDGLKGLIWLQWALLALFGMKRSAGFDRLIGFREDRVEQIAEQGIMMGAYRFAVDYLLGYRITDDLEHELSGEFQVMQRQSTKKAVKRYPHFTDIPVEFQWQIERALEDTVSAFIGRMSSLIRRMRYSEEDAIYQAQQSELQRIAQEEQRLAVQQQQQQQSLLQQSGFRYSRPIANASSISIPVAAAAAVPEPRRDTEALFLWIAVLYAGRADAGLRFWGRGDGTRVGLELDDRLAVFVRWGSDCREQGMIRGYFNMLSSLACGAQASACAYEFMRAAEGSMMSPSRAHVASNQAPLCSWSALFGAVGFYATQMRQGEADPLVVAPEMPEAEVGLLRSFLRLCGTVVRHSLVARTALYDSGEYQAVATMFSLLGCVVPVALKASLLDAIAAFGEADIAEDSAQADNVRQVVGEIARRNWGLLEQSQTLATTADADALRLARAGGEAEAERLAPRGLSIGRGAAGRHSRSGIAYELEEIEAAVETYPETRAFVRLVGSLIHVPASAAGVGDLSRDPALYSEAARSVPADLGSAYRVPGIGPYVGFVLDSVLLRAEQRAYRYASEKWSVYAGALDVVERSVATLDLSGGGGGGGSLRELVTHPGFEIAIRILCGSKLLDALLGVLGVGVDAVNAAAGGAESAMARAVLSALRILLRVLRVQDALLRHVIPRVLEAPGEVGLPLNLPRSLTTLEQLLLARRAAVVQVVAYVGCVASADVCLAAVKIVHILADSAAFSGVDDGAARGSALLTLNRLVGMVDASADSVRIQHAFIACLELRDGDGESDEDGDGDGDGAQAQAQAIRIAVLDLLLANITAAKPAPTIAHYLLGFGLARPATDELPDASQRATCLHAVLAQLRGGGPASARVAERCHHLVYRLCADPVTSDVTLRYLRAHENFFFAQLSAEEDEPMETPNASRVCAQLHARAWLWRGAALELHTLAQQDARTRARQLGEWLVGDAGGGSARDFLDARMRLLALLDAARSAVAGAAAALRREAEQQRVRDADADAMDLAMDGGGGGASDEAALGVDVASCVVANARGCAVYDLHALAALLRRGAQAAGGGAGAQAVIRRVVIRCFVANQERELHHASVGAVRAWRELAEVAVAHGFASGGGARPAFQLLRGVARVVAEPGADVGGGGADVVGVLAPTLALAAERLALELPQPPARELPVEPLLDAWRLLVAAALTPAAQSSLALRGNAYAAMLHFLRAARRAPISRLVAGVLDVLADSALGDRLLESVSADAADASDAWKTVAFSLLDALAAVFGADARANRVVLFLARRNYVASFVGALLRRDDQAIAATLHPDPPSLNALYIYEAKMALFLRLAQRADGAERLMECGAIDVLADCAFLDRRPASSGAAAFADAFLPARAERFHQLLMPALRLMLALVARIGRDHVALWLRAARFVAQHHAVLEAVLKDAALPAAALTLPLLAEARAVAQLVASIARHRAVLDRAPAGPAHVGVAALHLPMLALLPKLGAGCAWARRLLPITDIERAQALVPSPASDADADAAAAADDVARTVFGQHAAAAVDAITQHVVAYAQAVTEPQPHQQQQLHALRPAFSWPIEHAREADYLPSLATLVAFVRRALAQIERRRASRRENLRLARNSAAELTTAELRRLVAASPHAAEASAADLGPAQMRALAASVLTAQAQDIARSVAMLLAAVEQALVLLWRHLAFFISPVSPDQEAAVAASARLMATVMPSAQERDSLRTDASIALPPLLSLLADLGLTADELPTAATHSSFIQMLVRRIKDLVLRDASSM